MTDWIIYKYRYSDRHWARGRDGDRVFGVVGERQGVGSQRRDIHGVDRWLRE